MKIPCLLFISTIIMFISCNSSIEFENLKHTALGKAKLRVNKNLEIFNFGISGNDGMSVELGQPRFWAANMSIKKLDNSEIILNVLGSATNEEKTHSLSKMILRPTSNKIDVRAVFPTPTNDLFLSLGDSIIYSVLNFPRDSIISATGIKVGDVNGTEFSQMSQNGACFWGFNSNNNKVTLETKKGVVTGQKIIISEHIPKGQSIGLMRFNKMNITAKNIESITISSETIQK